nr:glutathione s-transferase 1 [Quercus suber]
MAEISATPAAVEPKITLHWLDRSRSQRIVWLLEECKGMTYDIKLYKRGADMLAPASLKEIHPLGKSPVISVEAPALAKPLVIAESGTLSDYLTDYFAKDLVPARYLPGKEGQVGGETEQFLRYRYYMHYAEGSLMTLMMLKLFTNSIKSGPDVPFFAKPITKIIGGRVESAFLNRNFKTQFDFLESQLATAPDGGKFICGKDLTAADIMMSFPLIAGKSYITKSEYPKLAAYVEMLESQPGYVRSVKKIENLSGEKFEAAFDR